VPVHGTATGKRLFCEEQAGKRQVQLIQLVSNALEFGRFFEYFPIGFDI
jgi:hypothetical protein